MKKILFTYFAPKHLSYTPLDIGYVCSVLKEKHPDTELEILKVEQKNYSNDDFKKLAYYLSSFEEDAIFLFLDSILWSRTYGMKAANKIGKELKIIQKNIFIGVQTYKSKAQERENILREKNIDVIITTDPENSFSFLDEIPEKQKIAGTAFIKNEQFFDIPEAEKEAKALDNIPSPYLQKVLDPFLKKISMEDENPFVFLQTSRGCPFGCYYCFRSIKFENMSYFSTKRIFDEIEYVIKNFQIFHFYIIDDCFITSEQRLENFIHEFEKRKKTNPLFEKITIGCMSRPEYLNETIVHLLNKLHIIHVQIGLQTVNPEIQKYMTRGISLKKFEEISELFQKYNIEMRLDIIMGLPNDNIESFKNTIDFAVSLNPKDVQVKQLYHHAGTRFDQKQKELEIELDEDFDFSVPYVKKAKNIDEYYKKTAYNYLIKAIKKHPEIHWKWLSEYGSCYDDTYNADELKEIE